MDAFSPIPVDPQQPAPATLGEVVAEQKLVQLPNGVTVRFNPNRVTIRSVQLLMSKLDAGDVDGSGAALFGQIVSWWDLSGPLEAWSDEVGAFVELVPAGQPAPISREVIGALPTQVLISTIRGVQQASLPNDLTGRPSSSH